MPVFLKILQRYTPTRPSVISAPLPLPGLSTLLMPETNILSGFVMHDEALRTSVWEADKKRKSNYKRFCCRFDVYDFRLVLHHRLLAAMKNPRKKETGMNLKQKVTAWLTLKDQSRKSTSSL